MREIDVAHASEFIHLFGESHKRDMRAERRTSIQPAPVDALQPFISICGFLAARRQHRLDLGLAEGVSLPGDRVEELVLLLDEPPASHIPSARTLMATTGRRLHSPITT